MNPLTFMFIAGEASGDALAAELATALREKLAPVHPKFFGTGGAKMAAAGVEIVHDTTRNAVFGLEAFARFGEFTRLFRKLLSMAIEREPDVIVCVDFFGLNGRFAQAVRRHVDTRRGRKWQPKIVQYVSPQVWASRPKRADNLARNADLLLAIFPFEKEWYAQRAPALRVEFVGNPIVDRYGGRAPNIEHRTSNTEHRTRNTEPLIVLLPGSRPSELKRHLPVFSEALNQIRAAKPNVRARMILSESLAAKAREIGLSDGIEIQTGDLASALSQADVAIAKSGTVTLECAWFGVPTVAMYKTSWATYAIAKRIVQVKWIAMPNILAGEEVFPEFIQHAATSENIARAALEFLNDEGRRNNVKMKLNRIAASLGEPGASRRAAKAILELVKPECRNT